MTIAGGLSGRFLHITTLTAVCCRIERLSYGVTDNTTRAWLRCALTFRGLREATRRRLRVGSRKGGDVVLQLLVWCKPTASAWLHYSARCSLWRCYESTSSVA